MDWDKPIEIAEDVFWVGAKIPGDRFQCHVYLLRQGDESVLLDPGSLITFEKTLDKIKSLVDPRKVRYFICHHQDPDITACISLYEKLFPRDDRLVVTHWRTQALLKHHRRRAGFYEITENGWKLQVGDGRLLRFIFTPYAHFPGSICTYDVKTKVLFSSDLFGGFISREDIFARDTSCFEDVKLFHEHYMPSKDVLVHALDQIKDLDLNLIAPQHGYIIRRDLIPRFMELLKGVECGLFKLSRETRNMAFLSSVGSFFQMAVEALIKSLSFEDILKEIYRALHELFGVEDLSVVGFGEQEKVLYHPLSGMERQILDGSRGDALRRLMQRMEGPFSVEPGEKLQESIGMASSPCYVLILLSLPKKDIGIALLGFGEEPEEFLKSGGEFIKKLGSMITHLLDREIEIASVERERERLYNYAVKDSLTGVYNRFYLNLQLRDFVANVLRYRVPFSVAILDIDHFKRVNDTYGHLAGDQVLKGIAGIITGCIRKGDTVIRYGGEEFLILLPHTHLDQACTVAERIRSSVEGARFVVDGSELRVTVSLGVASVEQGTRSLEDLIVKADSRLYRAKSGGRNKVVCKD